MIDYEIFLAFDAICTSDGRNSSGRRSYTKIHRDALLRRGFDRAIYVFCGKRKRKATSITRTADQCPNIRKFDIWAVRIAPRTPDLDSDGRAICRYRSIVDSYLLAMERIGKGCVSIEVRGGASHDLYMGRIKANGVFGADLRRYQQVTRKGVGLFIAAIRRHTVTAVYAEKHILPFAYHAGIDRERTVSDIVFPCPLKHAVFKPFCTVQDRVLLIICCCAPTIIDRRNVFCYRDGIVRRIELCSCIRWPIRGSIADVDRYRS